ncbi:MAG TPA: hypothetical protein VGC91_11990 [Pyrinomonadaceae bacterium]
MREHGVTSHQILKSLRELATDDCLPLICRQLTQALSLNLALTPCSRMGLDSGRLLAQAL